MQELRRAFKFFDRDGNGGVDLDEFRVGDRDTALLPASPPPVVAKTTCCLPAALAKFAGLAFEEKVLREIFSIVDPDGTGEINFMNFTNLLMASRSDTPPTCHLPPPPPPDRVCVCLPCRLPHRPPRTAPTSVLCPAAPQVRRGSVCRDRNGSAIRVPERRGK